MRDGMRRALPALAAAGVLLGAGLLWLAADVDGDGASAWAELRAGTNPAVGDTDGDGLADGWEMAHGTNPLDPDTDHDGLSDLVEVRQGSNPLDPDTDHDRIPDGQEPQGVDCDHDGFPAVRDGDDDNDHRMDGLEQPNERCRRDTDGDGVPDGFEGHWTCITNPDCDGDGLPDGQENGTAFDMLNPDTFHTGTPDVVTWAFQQSGQSAGTDADQDGIPDGWEAGGGLVPWGGLQPVAGEKDLLVEFLRVQGPDSGRFAWLDFTPAYQAVADAVLRERGVHLRWAETVVPVANETDPPLVPTATDPYYANVLAKGRYSANPYVTTVVLDPQHDQSQVAHAGVAAIRGVLAAVDYGSHVTMHFKASSGAGLAIQPVVESMVRGHRLDLLRDAGFDSAGAASGRIQLHATAGYTLSWSTSWFLTPIRATFDDGRPAVQLNLTSAEVDTPELAQTILHELGHTLGLCHAQDPACNQHFTAADRAAQATSTMSYDAAPGTLHFLDSEWKTALTYLTCPPQQPLLALAKHQGDAAVRAAKYAYANVNRTPDVRACADFTPVPRQIIPDDPRPERYTAPASMGNPQLAGQDMRPTYWYWLASGLATVGAGVGTWWGMRRPPVLAPS